MGEASGCLLNHERDLVYQPQRNVPEKNISYVLRRNNVVVKKTKAAPVKAAPDKGAPVKTDPAKTAPTKIIPAKPATKPSPAMPVKGAKPATKGKK